MCSCKQLPNVYDHERDFRTGVTGTDVPAKVPFFLGVSQQLDIPRAGQVPTGRSEGSDVMGKELFHFLPDVVVAIHVEAEITLRVTARFTGIEIQQSWERNNVMCQLR